MTKSKQRVVRIADVPVAPEVKVKDRTVTELLLVVDAGKITEVAKELTEKELVRLIDHALKVDREIKSRAPVLKAIKEVVLANAKSGKWKTKATAKSAAKISPSTSTGMNPTDVVKLLAKLKKQKLFDTMFSVKVGEVKKYLGEDVIEKIAKVSTDPYGSVSFSPLKKLK